MKFAPTEARHKVKCPKRVEGGLSLLQGEEDFAVEQFITQFTVEALAITVFSRAPSFDESRLGTYGGDPVTKNNGNELGAIACAYVRRNAAGDEQHAQGIDDVSSHELPCHADHHALTGELVDNAQHPESLGIVDAVSDEVL